MSGRTFLRRHLRRTMAVVMVLVVASAIMGGAQANAALGGTPRASTSMNSLDRGLVGWWKFDGNYKDSSALGNHGTGLNSPTVTTDRNGRASKAYAFNGTNQWIDFGNKTAFNQSNLTFAAWVKPNGTAGVQEILAKELNYKIRLNSTQLSILVGPLGTAWAQTPTFTGVFTANTWTHIVVTFDSTNSIIRAYANGSQIGTSPMTPITAFNTNNLFAATYNASGELLNGSLDDTRMYNRVLSASEVTDLYGSSTDTNSLNLGTGEKGLLGQWNLDGNVKDSSPFAGDGSVVNAATPTTDRRGIAASAYSFNGISGTGSYLQLPTLNTYNASPGQARTFSIWFKGSTQSHPSSLFYKNGSCLGWYINMDATGHIIAGNTTGSSACTGYSVYQISTSASYTDNQWHLVSLVVNRPALMEYLYVDGILNGSTSVDNALGSIGGNTRIGTDWNNGNPFAGSLDDARIYDHALTPTEIAAMYASYNSQIAIGNLQSGLVGYWPMNGNTKDATPNSANGTIVGNVVPSVDRKGVANSSYLLDGASGEAINLSSTGKYTQFGTKSFTASAWIKTIDAAAQRCIFSTAAGPQGFRFGLWSGRPYYLVGSGSPNFLEGQIGTAVVNDGNWHHLTIVYSYATSWTITAYIDGAQTGSVSVPGNVVSVTNPQAFIGSMGGGTSGVVTGSVDDLRVYNRALSSAEVAQLAGEYR